MSKTFSQTIRIGLLGGVVVLWMALIGMFETFNKRNIIENVVPLGTFLLLMGILLTAFVAARRAGGGAVLLFGHGVLAGVLATVPLCALVLLNLVLDLKAILVNITGPLLGILTFQQGVPGGLVFLLGVGLLVGALGALLYVAPPRVRRVAIVAAIWVIAFGVLQDLIRVTFSNIAGLPALLQSLYGSNGLALMGALTVFTIVALVDVAWGLLNPRLRARTAALPPTGQRNVRWAGYAVALLLLFIVPKALGDIYIAEVLNQVGLYVLMGLGLNIVVGFAGLLDLGYVAFFAIGAYTIGVLTSPTHGINFSFWLALPIALAVAVFFGFVLGIPVLKIRGDYLAIVTLGFGEIIRLFAQSDFLQPFLGGSQGILSIPKAQIGDLVFSGPIELYYLLLVGCIIVAFIAVRLKNSRLGRAWMAIREDEDVAQAMGIDMVRTKLAAFAIGATFAGISGAVFATKLANIYPSSFKLDISINVLALLIIGGMGSIPGVIVGALALVGLPELLREFDDYRLLVYGATLVLMMQLRPEGLLPEISRKRELHADVAPAPLTAPSDGEPVPAATD
jgi:branched-chain amino acid transport system permease protein